MLHPSIARLARLRSHRLLFVSCREVCHDILVLIAFMLAIYYISTYPSPFLLLPLFDLADSGLSLTLFVSPHSCNLLYYIQNPILAYPGIDSCRFSTNQGQEEPSEGAFHLSRWKNTPSLPYINQQVILETMEAHVSTLPLHHILMIWGAKSVGKSGALMTKVAEWEKQGYPVIEVDLKVCFCLPPPHSKK